ncbi:MAG: copper homeostasis protein CutC [Chloroflexi bacterium]|nr:copper homeostasis protein CutC [Chloroflexota bacterium]
MSFQFEVAVDSLESALIAQDCGADRIELCADLGIGGITPSLGMIQLVMERLRIPVHVMIRPRRGDFLYSDAEFEVMLSDIDAVKSAGAQGVVFGVLMADGHVDVERTSQLVDAARPLSVTFHRAFDMCRDPRAALAELIDMGVDTLLTSGQAPSAAEGMPLIVELVVWVAGRIDIMPGAGIHPGNIARIAEGTGAQTFHFSARETVDGPMRYRKARAVMGDENSEYARSYASAERIQKIMAALV